MKQPSSEDALRLVGLHRVNTENKDEMRTLEVFAVVVNRNCRVLLCDMVELDKDSLNFNRFGL